ncbi:MAG: DUF3501 family protein [Gammaproteobacteria bacterium]
MDKLKRQDLWGLEEYDEKREAFRRELMEYRRERRLAIGPHVTLHFEDRKTIRYQIQEMLRAEKIFEREGIEEELTAYNPLIPDGDNLKATMMIEYEDVAERRAALGKLGGIERKVWIAADGGERNYAVADEDMERSSEERTSAVHFLRLELDEAARKAFKDSGKLAAGVDHDRYREVVEPLPADLVQSLAQDLD